MNALAAASSAHLLGISRMTLWRKLQGLAETNAEHFE